MRTGRNIATKGKSLLRRRAYKTVRYRRRDILTAARLEADGRRLLAVHFTGSVDAAKDQNHGPNSPKSAS